MMFCPSCQKNTVTPINGTNTGICTYCQRIYSQPLMTVSDGMDPFMSALHTLSRPDLFNILQERVAAQTAELKQNLEGFGKISLSLDEMNATLREISKIHDTFKELRNTLADTNLHLQKLTEKL